VNGLNTAALFCKFLKYTVYLLSMFNTCVEPESRSRSRIEPESRSRSNSRIAFWPTLSGCPGIAYNNVGVCCGLVSVCLCVFVCVSVCLCVSVLGCVCLCVFVRVYVRFCVFLCVSASVTSIEYQAYLSLSCILYCAQYCPLGSSDFWLLLDFDNTSYIFGKVNKI
jgi:hypothetical protein